MSLVGNLEDLGLGDILQIVSLSRKSGVLSLSSRHREGKIVFSNGQVIRAVSSVYRENLGHLLLRKALVDIATLKKALLQQRNSSNPPRLGTILAEQFDVPGDAIEEAVKEQIEKIVYSFFGWTEGTFSFGLSEPEEIAATHFDPLQFMLDQGLNPQWLAMEGSRILDEKRHRGEELVEEPVEPTIDLDSLLEGVVDDEPIPVPDSAEIEPELEPVLDIAESGRRILVVDDDRLTCQGLFKALGDLGHQVESYDTGGDFLDRVEQLWAEGERPALLIDLIMPRIDGSGILGGLELLEVVGRKYPELDVQILTDHPNQDAEKKVRELGFPEVLAKPKKDALRNGEGEAALAGLARDISGRFGAKGTGNKGSGLHHFGRELLAEMGEAADDQNQKGPESPGLHLLKGMLQELNNPSLGGGIILLVLRFASELMNRAVIFLVKENDIVGLGQFGIDQGARQVDARIRKMRIPRRTDSVLDRAIEEHAPLRARLGTGEWDRYLCAQLGGGEPQEVFLGPILSEGHVVALIYGDNLPEQKPVGDTESLEIFLSQAGLAMEKALLESRLGSRDVI